MKNINVLVFPGTNCEVETARMIRQAGFASKVFRWNDDAQEIFASDGLVIPGGFSYEDRGRSGVVAAASAIKSTLERMAAAGKPILGICNGAQVLVEAGLVPGKNSDTPQMALARNRRQKNGEILGSGYYHDFVYIKPTGKPCAWTNFEAVLRMPIAHGEGRFLANDDLLASILKNGQNVMTYCDQNGEVKAAFPINPNGSLANLAAISNPQGNVMAMMPHPERVPEGQKIFESLHIFFAQVQAEPKPEQQSENASPALHILPKPELPLEIFITQKITDNAERTIEWAMRRAVGNSDLQLRRSQYWGIATTENIETLAKKLLFSGEIYNENKEGALVQINQKWFRVDKKELIATDKQTGGIALLAVENDDIVGEEKTTSLKKHLGIDAQITSGVLWEFSDIVDSEKLLKSALLANPISWKLFETTV